jgi:hypothetical protein
MITKVIILVLLWISLGLINKYIKKEKYQVFLSLIVLVIICIISYAIIKVYDNIYN